MAITIAGCGDDLHNALAAFPEELTSKGLFAVGYSLGGNALLNLLAAHRLDLLGAATVSAPIEPAQAAQRFMEPRNAAYHYWLLRQMKIESVAPGALVSEGERDAIETARTIYEFRRWFCRAAQRLRRCRRLLCPAPRAPGWWATSMCRR